MSSEHATLSLIGRSSPLFESDLETFDQQLTEVVNSGCFLVIGGAGSIGQAVVKEIFKRQPKKLHVVDISENNMVELVRDIRSTLGYIKGDFRTFAIDYGGQEFETLVELEGPYDFVFNLSALKHVRSEKDPYTLMRMIDVNILNTVKSIHLCRDRGASKYFCVSTDKAANPVNMMGASKRIMEMFLMRESLSLPISTARFANVAFSDGSLLHGFNQRFSKRQPISAPSDVRRYFVTAQESGELCLMACLLGENRDIFFPKLSEALDLVRFSDIAVRYLEAMGFDPFECDSEDEARAEAATLISRKQWPVYFFKSDTTGEKDFEEFFTGDETLDLVRMQAVGAIKNAPTFDADKLDYFMSEVINIRSKGTRDKLGIVDLFNYMLPEFAHQEAGRYLDGRM